MNGEVVSKRNSKCSHLDRGRFFRIIAVISDVIIAECKQEKTKKQRNIPLTCGLKLIIFISGLILDSKRYLQLSIALDNRP